MENSPDAEASVGVTLAAGARVDLRASIFKTTVILSLTPLEAETLGQALLRISDRAGALASE